MLDPLGSKINYSMQDGAVYSKSWEKIALILKYQVYLQNKQINF